MEGVRHNRVARVSHHEGGRLMGAPFINPTKTKSAAPDQENALSKVTISDDIARQAVSGIQARLCLAGAQIVRPTADGGFTVISPFMHTTRFSNLSALQAHADRVRV